MIDIVSILWMVKTWLLVHAAFFLFLLRISIRNLDKRLDAIEEKVRCRKSFPTRQGAVSAATLSSQSTATTGSPVPAGPYS